MPQSVEVVKPAHYGDTTPHVQIETGLGFTCDEGIFDLVMLLNRSNMVRTGPSCQGPCGPWVVPRGKILLYSRHDDSHELLDFCLRVKDKIAEDRFQYRGYGCDIHVTDYYINWWTKKHGVVASISFTDETKKELLTIVEEINKEEKSIF